MAPARGRHAVFLRHHHLAVRAGLAMLGAEVGVEVGMQRAGDVRGRVLLGARLGLHEVEAAVEHHERRASGLQGAQLIGGNEGGEGHGEELLDAWAAQHLRRM